MRDQRTRCSEEGCNEVAVSRASAHEGEGVVIYTGANRRTFRAPDAMSG
jgi:hypothetical protein